MTRSDNEQSGLIIIRVFDAPRELVWKAWTEPERMMRWWGPKGFTSPVCRIDLRVGGVYLGCMRSPEGQDFWSKGIYREIVEPERIVCTDSFADERGNVVPPSHYGLSSDFPLEMLVTVTFEDHAGKTRLTLRHAVGRAGRSGSSGLERILRQARRTLGKGETILTRNYGNDPPPSTRSSKGSDAAILGL